MNEFRFQAFDGNNFFVAQTEWTLESSPTVTTTALTQFRQQLGGSYSYRIQRRVAGVSGNDGSGSFGASGYSGVSGFSGQSGYSGMSGLSGVGVDGQSGASGASSEGTSGASGISGASGVSGATGSTGTSGFSGISGFSGATGTSSGTSGASGASGKSGFSGVSGATGSAGTSGTSGATGTGTSGASGASGTSGAAGSGGAAFATAGVAQSPVASGTQTITHNLGKTPTIIRLYGKGAFVSNAAATPTPSSIGIWCSSGNRCVYMTSAGTVSQASQTSSVFAIFLATSSGNNISGVIQNVGPTTFDIQWTETGNAAAQNFVWEAQ